ncbi:Acetoacetyl-CoA synthetase [Fusarium oxysporum f. sp. rapae]|uniref:Acetoacetyl-CoA synthetase n=1 Tax=Fusarium oxysporum f. sp. rapae TaxID=485398 RepID=A0A8J5NHL6_FUSOX|nr:Acetoacetyl-CoA synthetase [Fusarium oxysporum f. sp. rapae]
MSPRNITPANAIWKHLDPRATRLDAFRRRINRSYNLDIKTYAQLHEWSVEYLEAFCQEAWAFLGIIYSVPPEKVASSLENMWPRPEWFPGARMNFTENILAPGLTAHPDSVAVSACHESRKWRHLTWVQLRDQVVLYVSALEAAGVVAGDRIAGAIGAIFSSTAPDMGAEGIISRYTQIRPKILFVETEVLYAGKRRTLGNKIATAVDKLRERVPELSKVVVVNGAPLRDGLSDSVYYQYTTTGWMMWNLLVGSLSIGSRIVLYDGSPLYPSPAAQIGLLEEQDPKFLTALKQSGWKGPSALESLQVVVSAGSFLSPELFRWFYDNFPPEIGLFSGSGGTDLVGGIVTGNCLSPVFEGEISAPQLGMKVEIYDNKGQNVDNTGREGDLIISTPFFSMPVTFYGEDGLEKYRRAYFDKFPGVWCHGDFVKKNLDTGGYMISGRSDGVLNPGGIRFGTAEVYSLVDKLPDVEDCIAVGQRRPNESDEQVLLFLKMKTATFNKTKQAIRDMIREQLSPRHVPAHILEVKDIPYTLNGKKMESVVRDIVCKKRVGNLNSVANPECLCEFEKFAKLPSTAASPKL